MVSKADEKWDEVGDNPLVITSEIRRIMEEAEKKWHEQCSDFMNDQEVDKVLAMALRMMNDEFPDHDKIARVCARLEAFNIKFRTQYSAYMSYKKGTTEANMKKNHYKELYTGIDRLVDSLKYMIR
jgi:hypothetical protein